MCGAWHVGAPPASQLAPYLFHPPPARITCQFGMHKATFTALMCCVGMEAGPSQQGPHALFGEAMVTTPRGGSVKIPLSKNSSLGHSLWAIPPVAFLHAVLQEPLMTLGSWKVEAQEYYSRDAAPSEVSKLHEMVYMPPSTTIDFMVPLDSLVECLEQLAMRIHRVGHYEEP